MTWTLALVIVAVLAVLAGSVFALQRMGLWAWMGQRSVKELLAFGALLASIGGAGVLTINRLWMLSVLEKAQQWTRIGDIAVYDTIIIGIVIVSFGFAINKRSAKISVKEGTAEISGGSDT